MSPEQRLNQLLPVAPPREEKHQRKRPHEVGEEEDERREVKGEPSEAQSEKAPTKEKCLMQAAEGIAAPAQSERVSPEPSKQPSGARERSPPGRKRPAAPK
jgi:hypothetical protein